MKKIFTLFICVLIMLTSLPSAFAIEFDTPSTINTTSTSQSSTGDSIQREDVIVWKYRTLNGVLQRRRWNETRGYWVDSNWINV